MTRGAVLVLALVRRVVLAPWPPGSPPDIVWPRAVTVVLEATLPNPFRRLAELWWLWLVTGIAWIVVALIVLQFDDASINTVGIVIGLMFLAAAAQTLVFGALADGQLRWLQWIFGVSFALAGVVALIRPADTFAGVADILGFLFLVVGVYWLIAALTERGANEFWWFQLVAGIGMLVVAFWTAGQLLIAKAYVLLVFAGIWALLHGVGDLLRAFQLRAARETFGHP